MSTVDTTAKEIPAQFNTLVLSLASSAFMALGLEENPQTGKVEKDMQVARINIDLLGVLKEKTKNNLSPDEKLLLDSVVADLQTRYCQCAKS